MRGKTIALLELNIGKYVYNFGVETYFLNKAQKILTIKEKTGTLYFDKIKSHQKEPLIVKKQATK